jgi:hypothetical protein
VIVQRGDDNDATVDQQGSSNEASITQLNGDENEATVVQEPGDGVPGQNNLAVIVQNGSFNQTTIQQSGKNNRAGIKLVGDNNGIELEQTGDGHEYLLDFTGSDLGLLRGTVHRALRADGRRRRLTASRPDPTGGSDRSQPVVEPPEDGLVRRQAPVVRLDPLVDHPVEGRTLGEEVVVGCPCRVGVTVPRRLVAVAPGERVLGSSRFAGSRNHSIAGTQILASAEFPWTNTIGTCSRRGKSWTEEEEADRPPYAASVSQGRCASSQRDRGPGSIEPVATPPSHREEPDAMGPATASSGCTYRGVA